MTSRRETVRHFLFGGNRRWPRGGAAPRPAAPPRCSIDDAVVRGAARAAAGGGHPHRRRGDRRGARLHRRAERLDGRQHRGGRADGAGRLPQAGRPAAADVRPEHPARPDPRGRLRARPWRGAQRPLDGRAAGRLPGRRPGGLARAGRRRPPRPGCDAATMAQFAELVFAYIDELSAASVAGHTDELSTSGRVRERYRERLGQHLLAGAGADVLGRRRRAGGLAGAGHADRGAAAAAQVRGRCRVAGPGTLQVGEDLPGLPRRRSAGSSSRCCWCPDVDGPGPSAPAPGARRAGRRWSARRGRGPQVAGVVPPGAADRRRCVAADARRDGPVDTEDHLAELVVARRPARRWPTCAPGRSPRWPTCGPATARAARGDAARPGCCTRAAGTRSPRTCTCTRRRCATGWASCASCTATGSTTRARCSSCWWRCRPDPAAGDGGSADSGAPGDDLDSAAGTLEPVGCRVSTDTKVAPRAGDVPAQRRGGPRPARGRLGGDAARAAGDLAAEPASRWSG